MNTISLFNTKRLIPRKLKRVIQRWLPSKYYAQRTWSQCGEDQILLHLLRTIVVGRNVEYVDIGANHPFHLSNTALLYLHGGYGVLVEPNPQLALVLKVMRHRDQVLQCGVSTSDQTHGKYYMFDAHTLNTFSQQEYSRYMAMGEEPIGVISVVLKDVNEILGMVNHLDFLNIDIEGMDFEILKAIDWKRFRPTIICAETLTFEKEKLPAKLLCVHDYLIDKGYSVYADTHLNTIFVDGTKLIGNVSTCSKSV